MHVFQAIRPIKYFFHRFFRGADRKELHKPQRDYAFGPYHLSPQNRVLTCNGKTVACSAKSFDLLVLLAENAGRLVTRDEIQAALWGDRTIEYDQAINNNIRELRRLLGDDVANPAFIKTVPKHGYTFIPAVRDDTRNTPGPARPVTWAGAGLTASIIALLAFGAWSLNSGLPRQDINNGTSVPSESPGLESYLKGKKLLDEDHRQNAGEAVRWFHRAIEADEDYALAWAGLADALYYSASGNPGTIEQARRAADRALALNPGLASALLRRADILFTRAWDYAGAERDYTHALKADPGNIGIRHSYSAFLLATGYPDRAVAELNSALSINPLSAVMTSDMAWTLNLAGYPAEALEKCDLLLELAPDNLRSVACPLRPLLGLGQIDGASRVAAAIMAEAGVRPSATAPNDIISEYWLWRSQTAKSPFILAIAAARSGHPDEALGFLEKAYENRSSMMPFVHLYPEFEVLYNTPRFQAILPGQ